MNKALQEFSSNLDIAKLILIGEDHNSNGTRRIMHKNAKSIVQLLQELDKRIYFGFEHVDENKTAEQILKNLANQKDYTLLEIAVMTLEKEGQIFSFGGKNYHKIIKSILSGLDENSVCASLMGMNHLKTSVGLPGYLGNNDGIVMVEQVIDPNMPIITRKPDYQGIKTYVLHGEIS